MGSYSERRMGLRGIEQRRQKPLWTDGDHERRIDPAMILPQHEKQELGDALEKVDVRIREAVVKALAENMQKAGLNIDLAAMKTMYERGGELPPEYKAISAAFSEKLTPADFEKIAADLVVLGKSKDGDVIPADNVFLSLLQTAGGSVEVASDADMAKVAEAQGGKSLRKDYVRVYGGEALVYGAYGLNAVMFVVDTAIAKSILDYGLVSASSLLGPEGRSALSWVLSIGANLYLLQGKNNPAMLSPKTTRGRAHLAAFGLMATGAVTALAAQVVSSEKRADIASKAGPVFTTNLGTMETAATRLKGEVGGIKSQIEPLIKAKASAAAAEGKSTAAPSGGESPAVIAARKRLQAAEAQLAKATDAQRTARRRAVEQARTALAKAQGEVRPAIPTAVPTGADVPPNGPKSYTAWRVTYGATHMINGKSIQDYVPELAPEFAGFTVQKTEDAMRIIESEFGLQKGEGMVQLLAKLETGVQAVSVDKLLGEKQKLEVLVKQLSPNRLKYILGPIYSLYEGDLSGAMHGGADVEDLFARQPQLLAIAKAVAKDLAQVKVAEDLQRYQQRVKELTGLDLGIEFPRISFSLTEAQVDGWAIDRKQYADVLDRTTLSYLKDLSLKNDAVVLLGVLSVLLGGLFLTMGAHAARRRLREDNLSGYEAQEFAREEVVAKALADDLMTRERSVYTKLNALLTQQPKVTAVGDKVTVDLSLPPETPRSPERVQDILRRGMRIAAVRNLVKPDGMTDEEFTELKKAFIERRPRNGTFVKERWARAHLGSEELAAAYHAALDEWIVKLSKPNRSEALRAIRAEVTAFDGPNTERDAELDRMEAVLDRKKVYTAGQARELFEQFDRSFRIVESQDVLARITELSAQRAALIEEGAGRTLDLSGAVSLTPKDLLLTHILGGIDTELDYRVRLYEEIMGRNDDLRKALGVSELTADAKKELANRLTEFYAAERDDSWNGQSLSEIVSANEAVITKVKERIDRLADKAKAAFGAQAQEGSSVRFIMPYDAEYARRTLEIELVDKDGEEVATIPFTDKFPSAELDSDKKILEAIDKFLSEDSIPLQVAKAEARRSAVNAEIEEISGELPEELDISSLTDEVASRVDRLILLRDVFEEQGIALESYLRAGKELSGSQKALFSDRPEEAKFSKFWRKNFGEVARALATERSGKTVLYSIALNAFVVKQGDTQEDLVDVKDA